MYSWYSISFSKTRGGTNIFDGYLKVNTRTNILEGFYDKSLPSGQFYTNVLLPSNATYSYIDNIFVSNRFTYSGTLFYSTSIQNLYHTPVNIFNIYYNDTYDNAPNFNNFGLWIESPPLDVTIIYPVFTLIADPTLLPVSNICFPAGTPIKTNKGSVPIEQINPKVHTIRNKPIEGITRTINLFDKYLVCFEKDSLSPNVPSERTIMTTHHKLFYGGQMVFAKDLIGLNENIRRLKYKGEVLYNVLMEDYDKMMVNNLICETLHPSNDIAKIYKQCQNLCVEDQENIIKGYNSEYIKREKERRPRLH
jgi:hypothetical protein